MDEMMIQQIVEAVLKEMGAGPSASCCAEGSCKMLVIGDVADVPAHVAQGCQCLTIQDYIQNKNINRYEKVMITELTMTQLSDVAQGRDGSPESCAIVHALLSGIDVLMIEKALLHRKYSGKGSSRLYQTIENNVKLIQSYGVKMLKEQIHQTLEPPKPPKFQAPKLQVPKGNAQTNEDRVITEGIAQVIAARSQGTAYISKDAIVTPSAWDVFKAKGLQVVRQ